MLIPTLIDKSCLLTQTINVTHIIDIKENWWPIMAYSCKTMNPTTIIPFKGKAVE
jgi:hypothetical protein